MPSDFELTLTSHELFALPAGTPATGPAFRVEVNHEGSPPFTALARLLATKEEKGIRYKIFFRDEQRPEDEIFEGGSFYASARKPPLSEQELLQKVAKTIESRGYKRFWKIPELTYGLELFSFGLAEVIWKETEKDWDLEFYWNRQNGRASLSEWSTAQFHTFCEQLVNDRDSHLNFAMNWHERLPGDKTSFAIRCEQGDWEQMVSLFTSVLRLVVYQFGPYPFENRETSYWDFPRAIPTRYDRPAVFFARRWQDALFKIIGPAFWSDQYPLCAHRWRYKGAGVENTVYCETPTAHEYLEAQLRLRDFLRPYLGASEIEALFIP